MDKVKVGIIGVGYLGMQHARITSYLEEAELTAVADIDFKKALEIGNRHGVKYYQNFEDMLDEIDAGIVATPTSDHFRISMDLLRRGKHVLVEKPITETIEQAEQLVDMARRNGLILQVGHLERFNPAVEAVGTMISDPKFIEVQRLGSFSARSLDVDVVLDLMIHDLDIILDLIKDEVSVIRSSGIHVLSDKVDIANARLEFKNGTVANLTASRVSLGEPVRKIRIFQPESYISLDYSKKEMAVFTLGPGSEDDPMSRIRIEQVPIDDEDALRTELAAFAQAVQTRETPAVTGADGRRALHAAMQVHEEIRKSLKKFFKG